MTCFFGYEQAGFLHGGADCQELREQLFAGSFSIQHSLNPLDLPFDTAQARAQRVQWDGVRRLHSGRSSVRLPAAAGLAAGYPMEYIDSVTR